MESYPFPFVCFACRKSFKRPYSDSPRPCPDCSGDAIALARRFRAPRKNAVRPWRVVAYLVEHGFFYQPVHNELGEVIRYPTTMTAASQFVRQYRAQAI